MSCVLSVNDGQLRGGRTDAGVELLDVWGNPIRYVIAPKRRDHSLYFSFPGTPGEYNLWSTGPDGVDDSSGSAPPGYKTDVPIGGDPDPGDDVR